MTKTKPASEPTSTSAPKRAPKPKGSAKAVESALPRPRVAHACLEVGPLFGDARLVEGATFDPLYDRLFALGYPHFALLCDEELTPQALLERAPDALYGTKGVAPWGPWPRALARGVTRAFLDLPKAFVNDKGTLSEHAEQTLLDEAPIELDEAKGMFARLLSSWHSAPVYLHVPRLLEAQLGELATIALAEAVLALPDESLRSPQTGRFDLCVDFGLSLLRTQPATREELARSFRRRLQQLGTEFDPQSCAQGLDLAVNGREAIERAHPRGLGYFGLGKLDVPRDLALASFRARGDFWPTNQDIDARRPFLAGSEALLQECEWIPAFAKGSAHGFDRMAETYGHLRDPNTVALMLELAQKKASKKPATAWLTEHADFARPVLEQLAASPNERAALAAARLGAR
jgi:hypothetical protein